METEALITDGKYCISCNKCIDPSSRFCKHCGSSQLAGEIEQDTSQKYAGIRQAAIFYGIEVAACLTFDFTKALHTLTGDVCVTLLLAVNALVFFLLNRARFKAVLAWPHFSPLKLTGYCSIAIIASLLVSYSTFHLNHSLFSKQGNYFYFYSSYAYGKLLMILFVAVMPALFEEFAYRGYLLQVVRRVVDDKQAVFISAFLFAIIHISFISLYWLLPFALFLGYICVKEKTIWYGVAIHFCFNLTACIMELVRF